MPSRTQKMKKLISDLEINIIKKVEEKVRKSLLSAPGCHDWDHTRRVFYNAVKIAEEEMKHSIVDIFIIKTAALLHDIARPEELKREGKICHALLGSKIAPDILRECGVSDEKIIAKIAECIKRHRYRGKNPPPETIEEKIIFDADKLDSIGAVGVGRAIHFSGRIGSRLHNTEEEAINSVAYSENDSAYREYLVKLRHIPDKMLTDSGKKFATKRIEFMHLFFNTLNKETSIEI